MKNKIETYRAKWLIISPYKIIENGFITLKNGIVVQFGKYAKKKIENIKDIGERVIAPKLINGHIHLELSALKNNPLKKDFLEWTKNLIEERNRIGNQELKRSAKEELEKDSSTAFFAEISSLNITREVFKKAKKRVLFFKELIGDSFTKPSELKDSNLIVDSLACHAPHTSSPTVLKLAKEYTKKKEIPFSIHVGESEYETEFIKKKSGKWANFMEEKNINFKNWEISAKSSVEHLEKLKIFDEKSVLVHLLEATKKDFETIKKREAKICICCRSNFALHKKLPDIDEMMKCGLKPALGTDSLASCRTLDIFDEMAFIYKNYKNIAPNKIFEMATINGASSFFLKSNGSLEKGKSGDFLVLDIDSKDEKNLIEKVVNYNENIKRRSPLCHKSC